MSSFDWFQLSKLNEISPNPTALADLIRHAHFGEQLSRVPISLRQKLLIAFQNCSNIIKQRFLEQQSANDQLQMSKKALLTTTSIMKNELENSIAKIKSDKALIEEKKKMVQKLKEKLKKKQQKGKKNEVYFCPMCTRQDFASRNQFSFHLAKQHMQNIQNPQTQQNSTSQTIPAQVKDLILSLKDKQIQLMQMMLEKKKQMQTMELEKAYEFQIKKIKTQANFLQRKSAYASDSAKNGKSQDFDDDLEELRGQSQYLFYPSDVRNKNHLQEIDSHLYHAQSDIQHHFPRPRSDRHTMDQIYSQQGRYDNKPNDYYNIFNDEVAVSVQSSLSPQKISQPNPKQTLQKQFPNTNNNLAPKTGSFQNLNINQHMTTHPTPLTPFKPNQSSIQSYVYKESITPKQPEQSDRKYTSVYRESKSKVSEELDVHIFNCGPLIDDDGDGSEFQDYFGENGGEVSQDEILDEEIKIIPPRSHQLVPLDHAMSARQKKHDHSLINCKQSPIPNPNNHSNLLLQYSKDRSYFSISHSKADISQSQSHSKADISNSKDKSSDFIDLSNSFSKRVAESQKNNDQTINLSDLKLSKLERDKDSRRKELGEVREIGREELKKIHDRIGLYIDHGRNKSANSNILEEFKRDDEKEFMKIKKIEKIEHIESYTQPKVSLTGNRQLQRTGSGVLEQFLYKS